jgi:hypothetical protein
MRRLTGGLQADPQEIGANALPERMASAITPASPQVALP